MITSLLSAALLVVGYLIYSRIAERVFAPDDRPTPAFTCTDGVDFSPLPKWKAFLIELLNIAGTGPIFGAVSGALFGPVVYLWIVAGCILGGAVHDYFCGMISARHRGNSIVLLAEATLGRVMKAVMTVFAILLLVLVTAVFVVSPSSLLSSLTEGKVGAAAFMAVILFYYLLATILPIDKVIGKAYPVFGVILLVMAGAVVGGIFFRQGEYPMPELIGNLRDFSAENGGLPCWPFMFTTVACGAVSGFHATQAPMMSKCVRTEKDGRAVFYGAMVAEGIIALIWAAAAMAFFHVSDGSGWAELSALGGGNSDTVYRISSVVLGPVGSLLAIVGVVICPITSGDTALRSCRLILGEILGIDQKAIRNRLLLTLPLFAVIAGISVWNFLDPANFQLLWRWFAWSNQALATVALTVCTAYFLKEAKRPVYSLITALPMSFMCAVVVTYLLAEPNIALGRWIPAPVAFCFGALAAMSLLAGYLVLLLRETRKRSGRI